MRELKFRAWDNGAKMYQICAPMMNIHTGKISNDETGRFILEQYTGLHDKNGKEIYEGDIVRFLTQFPKIIIFRNGGFGFIMSDDFVGLPGHGYFDELIKAAEVIGNIHENPELLENKE
jgi:hypothetical protein